MARFPDRVTRSVEVTGEAADTFARNLGLSGGADLALPVEYLHGYGEPGPSNRLLWDAPMSRLVVGPHWLDASTSLNAFPVPRFTFDSPFLADSGTDYGDWRRLLRLLVPEPVQVTRTRQMAVARWAVNEHAAPLLEIKAHRWDAPDRQAWGHILVIGVDDRPASARGRAVAEWETHWQRNAGED